MSRFELQHSDIPVQVRTLPPIPPDFKSHQVNLEEGIFHKVVVSAEQLTRIPQIVLVAVVAVLDLAMAGWLGAVAVSGLALGQAADWLVLESLPRRGVSFGPVQTQWMTLVLVRVAAAVALTPSAPVGIIAQVAGIAIVAYAYLIEPARVDLSRVRIDVPGIVRGKTLRLLHVADVHLERFGTRERRLLQIVRETHPDAVLFSGDFLNLSNTHDGEAQRAARMLWAEISSHAPVYAVAGSPPVDPEDVVHKITDGLPLAWLRDEARILGCENGRVRVVGITCTHDPVRDGERLRAVCESAGSYDFTILLYHAPDLAPQAAALESIELHLAGHTHGGQIRLPWHGALITNSIYGKQLEMGLYRLNGMLLFVSRGLGLEGKGAPRARLLCTPQVLLLELQGTA